MYLWPQKVQNWLRKSSGIGSTSVSEREIETAHITNETEKAELEVKQEFMARVITDLEMKNTELETKECYGFFLPSGRVSQVWPRCGIGRQTVRKSDRSPGK